MKEQIETLRKEFNQKLDEILAAESPTKFKVGKWYINDNGNLYNYQQHGSYFGITYRGEWATHGSVLWESAGFRLATTNEIKEKLVKEAEKRGFKKGAEFKSAHSGNKYSVGGGPG